MGSDQSEAVLTWYKFHELGPQLAQASSSILRNVGSLFFSYLFCETECNGRYLLLRLSFFSLGAEMLASTVGVTLNTLAKRRHGGAARALL